MQTFFDKYTYDSFDKNFGVIYRTWENVYSFIFFFYFFIKKLSFLSNSW